MPEMGILPSLALQRNLPYAKIQIARSLPDRCDISHRCRGIFAQKNEEEYDASGFARHVTIFMILR